MALFDSGTPLANVALSDTFNTWRVRTNQINTQAAGLASNNTFTGTNNIFNGTLQATTANFTTLQADAIDFDGDLTVDDVTANTVGGTLSTAAQPNITSVGTLTGLTVSSTIAGSVNGSAATATTAGTVTTAAQPNITSVGTLTGLTVSATISGTTDGNAQAPQHKGGNYTMVAGDFIIATAGSITLTLPASPSTGDTVTVKDGTGAAETTNFTIARNGSNIASAASDLTFDKNFAEITMSYIDGTIGWSV